MSLRARAAVAAVTVVCLVVGVLVVVKLRRDNEWRHGADTLSVDVDVRLAGEKEFPAEVAALGGPGNLPSDLPGSVQAVVVRIRWSGPAHDSAWYQLAMLDGRFTPAPPLNPYGGWNSLGATGSNGAGVYNALAEHYDWLAGTAPIHDQRGWTDRLSVVDAPATAEGSLTAVFLTGENDIPLDDPGKLVGAFFLVDESGEVRWAKRIGG